MENKSTINKFKYEILIILHNIIVENENFLMQLLEIDNIKLLYEMTFYNGEGIIYQTLSLICRLLIKDELSWKVLQDIPILSRISQLLGVENLGIPLKITCIQLLVNLLNNHHEEKEIVDEVNRIIFILYL